MKNILFILALLASAVSYAQPAPYANPSTYRILGGNYQLPGNWLFRDTVWGDTAAFGYSSGSVLSWDTTGAASSGFMRLTSGAISGYPTGSGASGRVTYWSGASTITSNAGFLFNSTTTRLTTTGGTFPAMKIGNYSIVDTNSALRLKRGSVQKLSFNTAGTTSNDDLFLDDSLFIDKDLLNPSTGFFLGFDTTGSAASGYDKVYAKAGVTGSGLVNQIPYWATGTGLSGSNSFTFNPSTTAVALAAGTSVKPLAVTGADGDTVQILSSRMFQTSSGLTFQEGSGDGFNFLIDGAKSRLSLNSSSTVFNADAADGVDVSFVSLSGTALFVDHSDSRVGINEIVPQNPLHIDANTGIAIQLEDAQVAAADAGAGTLLNMPAGVSGDPDGYILMVINGVNVVIPFWNQ